MSLGVFSISIHSMHDALYTERLNLDILPDFIKSPDNESKSKKIQYDLSSSKFPEKWP